MSPVPEPTQRAAGKRAFWKIADAAFLVWRWLVAVQGIMDDKIKLGALSCLGLGLIMGIVGAASPT